MKKILPAGLLFLIAVFGSPAQENPSIILEYFEDEIELLDNDGFSVSDLYFGLELMPGYTVKTKKGIAELKIRPNGSIVRLAPQTEFAVQALQGLSGSASNDFKVIAGKVRMIAASVAGTAYTVRLPSAVCGIRGTDFGVEVVPGLKNVLALRNGRIEFTRDSGESIVVTTGQFADALSEAFRPAAFSPTDLTAFFGDLQFLRLDPAEVPGNSRNAISGDDGTGKSGTSRSDALAPMVLAPPADGQAGTGTENGMPTDGKTAAVVPSEPAENTDPKVADQSVGNFSVELGSIAINGVPYSEFILQPEFSIGDLKIALYLPVVYSNDLFDFSRWYRPNGNNEWSFGFDAHEDFGGHVLDFLTDVFLKVKYVRYGKQRDPFFLNAGNLSDITLGHGSVMKNYANDTDFPTLRRIGFSMGVNNEKVGIETMINDFLRPELFGLRFYTRPAAPAFNLGLGLTVASDINPAGELPSKDPAAVSSPVFLNAGIDLDLPLVESNPFSIILFADGAGMIPWFRASYGESIRPGFDTRFLYDPQASGARLRNYVLMTGILGNVALLDYRLDFRVYDGIMKPGFYGSSYDRVRGRLAQDVVAASGSGGKTGNGTTMGIYGEAGFSIFAVRMKAGYLWPWSYDAASNIKPSDDDYLSVMLEVPKGTIPVVNVYGSVSYSRTAFLSTLISGRTIDNHELSLFDENTVLKGRLALNLVPALDIAATIGTAIVKNGSTIVYTPDGRPKIGPVFGIETQIRF